ncbi:thioredoxin family protein [Evansella clarkii]|uniref:thioredoxin family protein n=1 Tax=Evansella clarkii TaxID=79879 RepID=UPI000B437C23|nr:thioredoxin family protein [Evansella clarkii]
MMLNCFLWEGKVLKKINSGRELSKIIEDSREPLLVYAFTPMCGTCRLAKQLLVVLEQTEGVPAIIEIDINYFKEEAAKWEITSVPCLLYIENSELRDKVYAFESVTKLYSFAKEQ